MTSVLRTLPLWLGLTLAAPAYAEPSKTERADQLFKEGRSAMKRRDYQLACERFAASQELDPGVGTLINLSECEENLGRLALSYRHIQEALRGLPPGDNRAPLAKSRLATLETRVGRLVLRLRGDAAEPSTKLLLDGIEISDRSSGIVVDPGAHTLLARASDGREEKRSIEVGAGRTADIEFSFATRSDKSNEPPPKKDAVVEPQKNNPGKESPGSSQLTLGLVVGGAGLVGVGLGVYFGLGFRDTVATSKTVCPSSVNCTEGEISRHSTLKAQSSTERTRSVLAFAAGGVAVAAGLVLVLTSPSTDTSTSSRRQPGRPSLALGLSPSGAFLSGGF